MRMNPLLLHIPMHASCGMWRISCSVFLLIADVQRLMPGGLRIMPDMVGFTSHTCDPVFQPCWISMLRAYFDGCDICDVVQWRWGVAATQACSQRVQGAEQEMRLHLSAAPCVHTLLAHCL